jgi:hypothetical protein
LIIGRPRLVLVIKRLIEGADLSFYKVNHR